jgi:GTP-binding protein EngB required for normal cell division
MSVRQTEKEGELDRTVIISSRKDITRRMAAFAQKQDLEKTVVISKKDEIAPAKKDVDRVIRRQMEKTVIITADTMDKYSSSSAGHDQNDDQENIDQAMEKTVIINPKANSAEDKTEIIRNNQHGRYNNDSLEKTVIVNPNKK